MKNLAIFDLDKTIISCDSDLAWVEYLYQQGLIDSDFLEQHRSNYLEYESGIIDDAVFIKSQLVSLTVANKETLENHLEIFLEKIIKLKIYPQALDLIIKHNNQQDKIVIISASNSFLVDGIAKLINVTNVIAIEAKQNQEGNFTGEILGIPSFRKGKIIRLNNWLETENLYLNDFDKTFFYSDSINDLPLLEYVTDPCAVNPDSYLLEIAKTQKWQIYFFE